MSKVPHIVEAYTDHSLGSLEKTDNTFDFALSREGLFFAVETPDGIRLTRDGSFSLNDEGVLVTKQGFTVLNSDYKTSDGVIAFNPEERVIEIDKNGQFYHSSPGSPQLVLGNKLLVVQPENVKYLKKEGDNLYIPDSADALDDIAENSAVLQGYMEKSNVNPINEMIAMIEANRLVGMYQKAMDSQMNDMNRDAIEKLAVTRK
jgi:flagellar basal-body rod protein FlgG